jgi:MFS superfamily sulfate permease-like transporter
MSSPPPPDDGTSSSETRSSTTSSETSLTSSDEIRVRDGLVPRRSSVPPRRPSIAPTAAPSGPFAHWKADAPAAVVVFLVALPLCLGIALASGAPLFAGLITGIVGGVVVAWASGSALSVSGPAAGLTAIVVAGIHEAGTYEAFLVAVVIAGAIQISLGFLRAGIIGYYFPSNVIRGLLAAIGALLILKQFPHAIGLDTDYMGDESFTGGDSRNTFVEIAYALTQLRWGAVIVAAIGLAILFGWERIPEAKRPKWLPAPLLVVVLGILVNLAFGAFAPGLAIGHEDLVSLPTGGPLGLLDALRFPDFSRIGDTAIWTMGATIAIVASIETLLCVEAVDKLDPYKRVTPTDRELKAQGIGNVIAGLLGGIPMTAVVVRGSANVQAGGRTRLSAFLHGALLLVAVVAIPWVLNHIPLAALAAVLLHVGYKLSPVSLFRKMYALGWEQFLPFAATFVAILFTDLLKGVAIGLAISLFFILKRNFEMPYFMSREEKHAVEGVPWIRFDLAEHVSFLHKASLIRALQGIPKNSMVEIDGSGSRFIDRDVLEIIYDFRTEAKLKNIDVVLIDVPRPEGSVGGH